MRAISLEDRRAGPISDEISGPEDRSLFAAELAVSIAQRGLKLTDLSARLGRLGSPVSVAALSYWRSGQRHPDLDRSKDAIGHLEEILGLEPGRLLGLVQRPAWRGVDRAIGYDELIGKPGARSVVLADMTVDTSLVVAVGGDLTVHIGADRRVNRSVNRIIWRSRTHGARRVVAFHAVDDPGAAALEVTPLYGCSLGRSSYDPHSGLLATELILDRALAQNETAITEHVTTGDCSPDVTHYESVAERRVTDSRLWVHFDPRALPSQCEAYEDSSAGIVRSTAPLAGTSAHHMVHQFGPGVFGLTWTW